MKMDLKNPAAPSLVERLLRLLYPPVCVFCGCILPIHATLWQCRTCAEKTVAAEPRWQVRTLSPAIQGTWAPFGYHGAPKEAILRMKYQGQPTCADTLAWHVAKGLAAMEPAAEFDVILPVPMTAVRKRRRGYNQAERLARALSSLVQVPMRADVLVRSSAKREQHLLGRRERMLSKSNEYQVRMPLPEGIRILLVDDVLTTGSTISACGDALADAGAGSVHAVCVAFA